MEKIKKINPDTHMIDIDLFGIKGAGAVYLVSGKKTCLIDSGSKKEAKRIIKALDSISVFPDILILTHSHFDHSQGAPILLKEAKKRGKELQIAASEKALKNLEDQSWNKIFGKGKYENIKDVKPLKEKDIIDLKGIELEMFDFSGHCTDDLGIYDRQNKTMYLGDSLGYKVQDLYVPPFMPPFWNEEAFYNTVSKLKEVDYKTLCLAHFGPVKGDEAKEFPDKMVKTFEGWWNIFVSIDGENKLNDINYVIETIINRMEITLPDLEISSRYAESLLKLVNFFNRVIGRKQLAVADLQIEALIGWLIKGFRN